MDLNKSLDVLLSPVAGIYELQVLVYVQEV